MACITNTPRVGGNAGATDRQGNSSHGPVGHLNAIDDELAGGEPSSQRIYQRTRAAIVLDGVTPSSPSREVRDQHECYRQDLAENANRLMVFAIAVAFFAIALVLGAKSIGVL